MIKFPILVCYSLLCCVLKVSLPAQYFIEEDVPIERKYCVFGGEFIFKDLVITFCDAYFIMGLA